MEQIYFNGDIITMEEENDAVQAVLVKEDKIAGMGSLQEMERLASENAVKVDLKGRTLMPAFIDPHSHITALSSTLDFVQLGAAGNFREIQEALRQHIAEHKLGSDEVVIGFGYDHNNLSEGIHPDKTVLDAVGPNPVLITHTSGHMGVANSRILDMLHIDDKTEDPKGGKIGRVSGSREPNGYLEETAFIRSTAGVALPQTKEQQMDAMIRAQEVYLKNGITTVQDGLMHRREYEMLNEAAGEQKLTVDVVGYVDINGGAELMKEAAAYTKGYHNRFRIGGYKLILDGSPQGRTAWLSKPYENGDDDYCGYPVYEDGKVKEYIKQAEREERQILVHCNGDAASEQLISVYEKPSRLRPVMIHAQTVRKDQLERMKAIGMIPSFFAAHTYYWGDVHRKNLGEVRADRISPAKTAQELGIPFTLHQDSPVLPPDMIDTIWCAVNRRTKSGHLLGGQERISVYEALKAVTINAAYQYFEEDRKGSIRPGKLADLIILSKNPLKMKAEDLRDIKVLETIKEGKVVMKEKDKG
ncbi:amidohydrolase [Anaerolentibacter hominis]|uniref:amidohydrolase n=1 Tax=Anaerolentibacter hominis TaxID=3079009 RepID=UPI0031B8018D